jgi:hypothetical protein
LKLSRSFVTTLIALPLLSISARAQISATPNWDAAGAAWWTHVQYLASDERQGRLPGTPGFEDATKYLEDQFKAIGLKPGAGASYRQPIRLLPSRIDAARSSVELESKGNRTTVSLTDITLSPHVDKAGAVTGAVDAPLVFIGYGLRLPTKHMDDYAGVDLHGKVAVFYNGAPSRLQGPLRAYSRIPAQRWKALKAAGAIGMIAITPPRPGAPPPPTAPGRPARPTMLFADPSMDNLSGLRLNASMLPGVADQILAPSGHTLAELQPLIDAGKPLPSFAMNTSVHAVTVVETAAPIDTQNVVGLLEGSDRTLKNEYLVISAHLDHLGVGRPVNGDTIYNGAMDNASGIASVIECAKLLAGGARPKRSILFIGLTGEEMGELGSAYFAARPTVDKAHIVADLNMDMYLPLFPLRFLEVQGLGESTLGNDARAVAQLNDVEVQFDKQPDENRFIRSDQVNFVAEGIPALAFKFGWTPDSAEMKTFNEWVKTRYHQPSDDLNQPIDKAAAAQFTSLLAQLATRVANTPARPSWYPESSFSHQ